jgi:hypothetical protein
MLTIRNKEKLRYKPVGKLNFYVDRMRDIFDLEPDGSGGFKPINHKYEISITNRTYSITITLTRESSMLGSMNVYTLDSSTGHKLYLLKGEINNIDVFIEKLTLVALSGFK